MRPSQFVPGRVHRVDPGDAKYPMRAALAPGATLVTAPMRKRWRLPRAVQLDQGQTPECVAYTGKHWEMAEPIQFRGGETPQALYAACKVIDGDSGDGTSGRSLMKVYQQQKRIGTYYWWLGDDEALKIWLLTRGGVWVGINLSESFFTPDAQGRVVWGEPNPQYGHEMLLIGYDRATDTVEGVNSWGIDWGLRGRWFSKWDGFSRILNANGDACGAVEVEPTV